MCLQRFVKSNGPQAFLCRTIYCKNESSTCFLITNKKTFFDKEELEIKKLVARPKDRCTIVKSKQGKNLSDTKSTLERIMQFLLFHRGIELTELVGDFIKDEVGNWWLVSIKAFKMIEKLSRVKSSPIYGSGMMKMAPSSAKANKNSE
jgi:LMBR1 domain-containing protein 1